MHTKRKSLFRLHLDEVIFVELMKLCIDYKIPHGVLRLVVMMEQEGPWRCDDGGVDSCE